MAFVRRTFPVVLTVSAGFIGYRYIFQAKQYDPVQISNGITVDQPWRVLVLHILSKIYIYFMPVVLKLFTTWLYQ